MSSLEFQGERGPETILHCGYRHRNRLFPQKHHQHQHQYQSFFFSTHVHFCLDVLLFHSSVYTVQYSSCAINGIGIVQSVIVIKVCSELFQRKVMTTLTSVAPPGPFECDAELCTRYTQYTHHRRMTASFELGRKAYAYVAPSRPPGLWAVGLV